MSHANLPPIPPPGSPKLADRLARPFLRFLELEVGSAILLLSMSAAALLWANSPWSGTYDAFWQTPVAFRVGDVFAIELSLVAWVNDALMAIFFFVVGMEIKREMVEGELSSRPKAMLPVLAALGGMIVPAGIYAAFHAGGDAARGWGVPMATDIAFAVAALSVLGTRVPSGLRIFLLALAIADDLGAVAVIAIFYTAEIRLDALALAGFGLALCVVLNAIGVRSFLVYVVVGVFVWYETHHSGVHATIAGVLLGLITPTDAHDDHETLLERGRSALERLGSLLTSGGEERVDPTGHERHQLLQHLIGVGRFSLSPLDFLVNVLERPVAFFIMPVFALANAGVSLDAATLGNPAAAQVGIAVALGLIIGKPVGITLFSWLAVKLRFAVLPAGVNWGMLMATGMLAGIGFTVALFITALAFTDPVHVAGSKLGILAGSAVATVAGLAALAHFMPSPPPPPPAALSGD